MWRSICPRVAGRVLDDMLAHLLLAAPEQQVVLGEIGVTEHVRGHQYVIRQAIAGGEVGVARIARKHHLEQARIAHVPLHQLVDVACAERPVRHAHRQAIDRDLGHEAVGHRLEDHRRPVQSQPMGQLLHAGHVIAPRRRHGGTLPETAAPACASAVKKCRTASAMSSGTPTENRPTGSPAAAASSNRRTVSVCTPRTALGEISR